MKLFRQTTENECGISCIQMIVHNDQIEVDPELIKKYAWHSERGVTALGLKKAFEKLGYYAEGYSISSPEEFRQLSTPFIVLLELDIGPHYAVVSRIGKRITLFDPARGKLILDFDTFWNEFSNVVLVAYKTHELESPGKQKMLHYFGFSNMKLISLWVLASLIVTFLVMAQSSYLKVVMDSVIQMNSTQNLWTITMLFILLIVFQLFLRLGNSLYISSITHKLFKEIMYGFLERIKKMSYVKMHQITKEEHMKKFVNLITFKDELVQFISSTLLELFSLISYLMLIFFIEKDLFFIYLTLLSSYGTITYFLMKFNHYLIKINYEIEYKFTKHFLEFFNHLESYVIRNRYPKRWLKTELQIASFGKQTFDLSKSLHLFQTFEFLVENGIRMLLIYQGTLLVLEDSLSLSLFILVLTLQSMSFASLKNIVATTFKYPLLMKTKEHLAFFMRETEEPIGRIVDAKTLEIENVSFNYHYSKLILKDVSYRFEVGKSYLIYGENGAGKSTLLKFLANYYETYDGKLSIDGADCRQYSAQSLVDVLDLITTDNHVFYGSLLDFFEMDQATTKLNDLLKEYNMYDRIEEMPLGMMTHLANHQIHFSKGEKQRLMIIKTILSKRKILLVDEIDSHLDDETVRILNRSLGELARERLIIFVSHRPSRYDFYDHFLSLEGGNLCEFQQ